MTATEREQLLKRFADNGYIVPLDMTEDERRLLAEITDHDKAAKIMPGGDSPQGNARPTTLTPPEFLDKLSYRLNEMDDTGQTRDWYEWNEQEYGDTPDPAEFRTQLDKMAPLEREVCAALTGVTTSGEKSDRGAMKLDEVAELLGITVEETEELANSGLRRMTDEEFSAVIEGVSTYGLRPVEGVGNRLIDYDIGAKTIGSDPASMETPMEVDDWVGAVVHWQATMVKTFRSAEGQSHLKDFMNIEEPVAQLAEYKAQNAIAPRGIPENISRRFPRLAIDSLKGELHATTKRMVEAAEARVADYDYAWLQKDELPAESGLVIIPEGAWELDYFNTEADDGYKGVGHIVALSWTCVAGGVMVCLWDELEHAETFSVDIHHVWFCDMNVGGHGYGPLLSPYANDYPDKFNELNMSGLKEEWDTMMDRLIEAWLMIAKGAEIIRMLGEELLFAQQRRPQFADKNTKRQTKKVLEEIPDILIYDLRRYSVNPTGPNDGESIPREYSHSFDVRGHPRVLNRGTADERVIWVRPHRKAVDKPYIKKDRIGVLRR